MKKLTYTVRKEHPVKIPIPGSKLHINGIVRGDWSRPMVILLHGLPGAEHDLLQYLAARYLTEQGFITLRINLYDFDSGTRNLTDCTLQTHADDLGVIVEYVRHQGTPAIFACGHSYGGLAILRSTATLDGAILWDPSHFQCSVSYDRERQKAPHLRLKEQQIIVYTSGYGYLDPIPMEQERITQSAHSLDWAKKPYPTLFIAAGKGQLTPYIKKYIAIADHPAQLHIIKNATHCFRDSDEVLFELLQKTSQWLKKHI